MSRSNPINAYSPVTAPDATVFANQLPGLYNDRSARPS